MRKTLWWFTAVTVFAAMICLLLDIGAYLTDVNSTITAVSQRYFNAGPGSFRSGLIGFVFGALLVHVTRWGRSPNT
jgi:hypothetical protein